MIDTSSWKEFRVGDLFDVSRPSSRSSQSYKEGNMPFVASGNFNNGITAYLQPKDDNDYDEGGCITVSAVDGYAFYQKDRFLGRGGAGSSIMMLRNDNLNELNGKYICTLIRKACNDWEYSNMGNKDKLADTVIWLPITSTGEPDWEYMESYMKAVMEESEKSLENLKKADDTKHLIDVSGWGEFRVGDLFDKLTLKCLKKDFNKAIDCSEEQTDEFSLPLTNAKHFNNGIQFYGRPDDWESAEMTIDIVSNGAIATGDVYAQPQRTGVLWDSYLVKCKYDITSELVLQYMSCVIQRCVKQYFGWDDKCTWDKVKEQMIRLPITSTGEPDWQYMEDYMRRIMDKSEQIISDLQIGA